VVSLIGSNVEFASTLKNSLVKISKSVWLVGFIVYFIRFFNGQLHMKTKRTLLYYLLICLCVRESGVKDLNIQESYSLLFNLCYTNSKCRDRVEVNYECLSRGS